MIMTKGWRKVLRRAEKGWYRKRKWYSALIGSTVMWRGMEINLLILRYGDTSGVSEGQKLIFSSKYHKFKTYSLTERSIKILH